MSLLIELKEAGNRYFKSNDFVNAIKYYTDAIEKFGPDSVLYSNRAQCLIKLLEWQRAIVDTELGLKLKCSSNIRVKLLFRQGVALRGSGKYTEAKRSLQSILELEPENKDAQMQLELLLGPDLKKLCVRNDVPITLEVVQKLPMEYVDIVNSIIEKKRANLDIDGLENQRQKVNKG